MNIIIVGIGRMGAGIAENLLKKGHDVTVIDYNRDVLNSFTPSSDCKKIKGEGLDKEILERAGIRSVDALVASTKSDEINAVIARIAKNVYYVPHVIARLYEPRKAEIYKRFGILTISSTSWGIERGTELITYDQLDSVYEFGNGNVNIVRIETPTLLIGHTIDEISIMGEVNIISVSRENKTFIPYHGTILMQGDILYIAVMVSATDKLKKIMGLNL